MNAIKNTIESDTYLRVVKSKKVIKTILQKSFLNTLVPDFTFLNHKGEEIAVTPTKIF